MFQKGSRSSASLVLPAFVIVGIASCSLIDLDPLTSGGAANPTGGDATTPVTNSSSTGGTVGCPDGFGDCDPAGDGVCETNVLTNNGHCGGCAFDCSPETELCDDGVCGCIPTLGDCSKRGTCDTDLLATADHCGACNIVCESFVCDTGKCEPTLVWTGAAGDAPHGIAVNSTHLFVVAGTDLFQMTLEGGPPEAIDGSIYQGDRVIATETMVLWSASREIKRYTLPTGPSEFFVDDGAPMDLVLQDGDVFFTDRANPTIPEDGEVRKKPLTAAPSVEPTVIASGQLEPYGIDADNSNVFWVTAGQAVRRADHAGSGLEDLATDDVGVDLAISAGDVVWQGPAAIHAVPKVGGSPSSLGGGDAAGSVLFDEGFAYATQPGAGLVVRVDLVNRDVVVLADDLDSPTGLAASPTHVYFTARVGTAPVVYRLAK